MEKTLSRELAGWEIFVITYWWWETPSSTMLLFVRTQGLKTSEACCVLLPCIIDVQWYQRLSPQVGLMVFRLLILSFLHDRLRGTTLQTEPFGSQDASGHQCSTSPDVQKVCLPFYKGTAGIDIGRTTLVRLILCLTHDKNCLMVVCLPPPTLPLQLRLYCHGTLLLHWTQVIQSFCDIWAT